MNKDRFLNHERTAAAADDTFCTCCGEGFEISLLVPPEEKGGNRRRLKRHYECQSCGHFFSRYDLGFVLVFLISPSKIANFLFKSPRQYRREAENPRGPVQQLRGEFKRVSLRNSQPELLRITHVPAKTGRQGGATVGLQLLLSSKGFGRINDPVQQHLA